MGTSKTGIFLMKNILIIGDSHIKSFKNKKFNNYKFDIIKCGGASAQGLNNINSQKKTLLKTLKFLKSNNTNYEYVILCFGEVDCNATIWYYKDKYKQTLEDALNRTVNEYVKFIITHIENYFNKEQIIIFGAVLPTVADNIVKTVDLRKDISATQKERTDLTDMYNSLLKSSSSKHNWIFLTVNDAIRDTTTMLVDKKYIKNPVDHHLPKKISFELWVDQLEPILDS